LGSRGTPEPFNDRRYLEEYNDKLKAVDVDITCIRWFALVSTLKDFERPLNVKPKVEASTIGSSSSGLGSISPGQNVHCTRDNFPNFFGPWVFIKLDIEEDASKWGFNLFRCWYLLLGVPKQGRLFFGDKGRDTVLDCFWELLAQLLLESARFEIAEYDKIPCFKVSTHRIADRKHPSSCP
jgi:hypothetical protein